jgi:hypothetical protein
MKFIRDLLGKKRKEAVVQRSDRIESLEQSYRETIGAMSAQPSAPAASVVEAPAMQAPPVTPAPAPKLPVSPNKTRLIDPSAQAGQTPGADGAPASVNIWDLEDSASATPETPHTTATATATRSPARSRRTKTRLIGFEKSDGDVVDLFNDTATAIPTKSVKFPVGWLVVADGPGRGESFPLFTGMTQIGRGEDQAVQLDFGDNSISRSNHAAIVYDPDNADFLLGHGGKSNIVRLNDKPVISNEPIKTGDIIRIGDTVLRFVALCSESFNWSDEGSEEDEDVAIA